MTDNILPIRQSSQQKQIVDLINRFDGFAEVVPEYIMKDFNSNELDQWAAAADISKGQRVIARFILGVWDLYNLDNWKCGKFCIFDAAGVLSSGNLAVISEWIKKPFFV